MKTIKYDDWDQKRDLLEKIDLFRGFSRFDIPKVAVLYDHVILFEQHERIIRQGANDKCFYILLSGSVRICKNDGPESLVDLSPGQFFGEISFLSKNRRTRHVFANKKSFVLKVTNAMLSKLDVALRERIKDKLIEKLVERIMDPNYR
jgi:CRP/FNR family transcriptional regulator, cyclic AMP receptor protein